MQTNYTTEIRTSWDHLFSTVEPNKTAKRALSRINGLQWWCVYSNHGHKFGIAFDISDEVAKQQFKGYKFISIEVFPEDEQALLTIFLKGEDFKSEFALLCSHLMRIVSSSYTDSERVRKVINELSQWEKLFSKFQNDGKLSFNRQLGLLGELFLLESLIKADIFTKNTIVEYWEGPEASARDFQGANWAIEVKTSAKSRPRIVHINGERQLGIF